MAADRAHIVELGVIGLQGFSGAHIDKLTVSELAPTDVRVSDDSMADLTTPNGGVGGRYRSYPAAFWERFAKHID